MDIELLAVAAIIDSIAVTDRLSLSININDKEPSWDGSINIYDNKSKRKEQLRCVPFQIKGTTTVDITKSNIRFQVDRNDLENYLRDGGVIFFVVGISKDGMQKNIYYAPLLPVKLQQILKDCKKSKLLDFKEFPTDNDAKTRLFLNFFDDMKKQTSFANTKILSIEELGPGIENLSTTVYVEDLNNFDPIKIVFNNEVSWYATFKGDPIPRPILPFPETHIFQHINAEITVGNKIFYNQFQRIHSKIGFTIKIGNSIQLVFLDATPEIINIKYDEAPLLADAVVDLDFWMSALEAEQFEIDGHPLPFKIPEKEIDKFNVPAHHKKLHILKRIEKLFELLNLNKQVDISGLNRQSKIHINILLKAILDQEMVTNLQEDIHGLRILEIGNQKVLLFFEKTEVPGSYLISDFFKVPIMLAIDLNGEKFLVPLCTFLTKENYLELANLDCDAMLRSYKEMAGNPGLYESANNTLLNLLLAYDDSNDERKDLLTAAESFTEWLYDLSFEETKLPGEICDLNRLQIVKRKRKLTSEEKKLIWTLLEQAEQRTDIKVGAHLLLDNQEAAEIQFNLLSQDEQESFKQYPIYRFWKNGEE